MTTPIGRIDTPPKGRSLSAEHRAKISEAVRGRPKSAEHRAKIGEANKRRKRRNYGRLSAETRAKIAATLKGVRHSPEHRAKLSAGWTHKRRAEMSSRTTGNQYTKTAPVKGECVYCGDPGRTYDHVIPRGRPGWDDPDNLVVACHSCNAAKGQRTPEEWFTDSQRHHPTHISQEVSKCL